MRGVLAMVLGGGRGTRLFPLTQVRSKPAVPLGGKYRLVDVPISNCINAGIDKIFVLTQYNSESLNRHINQTYRFGVFSQGFVDVLAAEQTPQGGSWFKGTADAVRQCLRHVLNYNAQQLLILSGDQLYRMDFVRLLAQHRERGSQITVCGVPVGKAEASAFGILKIDQEGRILEFVEKPSRPEQLERLMTDPALWSDTRLCGERPFLASMGIYVFDVPVLEDFLRDESKLDFGRDILPASLDRCRVDSFIFNGYWQDIGTIGAFYRANLDLASTKPRFNFYNVKAPIYTHPRFLPASRILECQVAECVISEGCVISRSTITHCVIGIRSIIGEGSSLRHTLMMGADYYETGPAAAVPLGVGPETVIRDAILDKNARIGRGVRIVNEKGVKELDGENYFIREGIVVIPKGATIADGTVI